MTEGAPARRRAPPQFAAVRYCAPSARPGPPGTSPRARTARPASTRVLPPGRHDHPTRRLDLRRGWLRRVVVLLVAVAQLACTLLPVLDGWRGPGKGPHIEAVGGEPHCSHDVDTCVACHGCVFEAAAGPTFDVAPAVLRRRSTPPANRPTAPGAAPRVAHRSRAPPVVS